MFKNKKTLLAVLLAVGTVALFIAQIVLTKDASSTELALINVLQIISSLGASWLVSSHFSEVGFLDSQKKFAIGAFRRIKEIERAIQRAQQLLSSDDSGKEDSPSKNLRPVMICMLSAQDAVNSSIADWGDIIGDEIHLTKEISRLQGLRKNSEKFEREYFNSLKASVKSQEEIESKINVLRAELPASLRYDSSDIDKAAELAIADFNNEIDEFGTLELTAAWEPEDSFGAYEGNIEIGKTLYIYRGYTEARSNALFVHNEEGVAVAVVFNKFREYCDGVAMGYDHFVDLLEICLDTNLAPSTTGRKPLPVRVTALFDANEAGYRHFTITLDVSAIKGRTAAQLELA